MENRTDRTYRRTRTRASVKLRISDFCDMGQFKRILCDWAWNRVGDSRTG